MKKIGLALAALLLAGPITPRADAQFSFGWSGKRGSTVSVNVGNRGFSGQYSYGYGRNRNDSCDYNRRSGNSRRVWVEGRYDSRPRKIWVEGRVEKRWIPARYETRYDDCGRPIRVCVANGYWDHYREKGYYNTSYQKVWVPGYWKNVRY